MQIGSLAVRVVRKNIKNMYIRVLPPDGVVAVSAPIHVSEQAIHSAVNERMAWIHKQRSLLSKVSVRPELNLVSDEVWFVRGKPHKLIVHTGHGRSYVNLGVDTLELYVGLEADYAQRLAVLNNFYRGLLKQDVPPLLEKWERIIGVKSSSWHIKRMKTRWGSCNTRVGRVWLNLELAKKSTECLEYVLVHELVHLLEPSHNHRFKSFMDRFLPDWRIRKSVLNKQA